MLCAVLKYRVFENIARDTEHAAAMPEAGTDAGSGAVYVCYMSSFGFLPPCLESSLLTFGVSPPQKPGLGPGAS